MLKPVERKRAELASLSRVAASLINERLVTATFAGTSIMLSHPATEETMTVQLPEPLQFKQAVHASELAGDIVYYDRTVSDGAELMRIFGKWTKLPCERVDQICSELENSVQNLEKSVPAEVVADYRLRACRYPLVDGCETAVLHFVAVPREGLTIVGDYQQHIAQLLQGGHNLVDNDRIIFPVHKTSSNHHWSIPELSPVHILPGANVGFCIKVPLAVKITSIVRTIRRWAITIGHRLEPMLQVIENAAASFGGSLGVIREVAAAASPSENLGCIIREFTESIAVETGERIIICTAIAEHMPDVWPGLLCFEAKLNLLRDFCMHLFRSVLPSVLLHGFALQAHMQNLLIRLDPTTRKIKRFLVRDLGSFRVHRETFWRSTSLTVDTSWILTKSDSLEKVYRFILSVIHGDIASMIRALKLGMEGWRVARVELGRVIPADNELARKTWLESAECMSRAHLSMQLYGVARECKMARIPNRFYYCQV
ncbi:hypothetical protein BJX64DRAFT_290638 [Aspergillus heterothallicus]